MRKPAMLTALITIVAVLSLAHVSSAFSSAPAAPAAQQPEAPSARAMLDAWRAFAAGIDETAHQKAAFPFESDQRLDWFYTPVERTGLPIGDLDASQLSQLRAFLRTGLGENGTSQAFDIVKLEEVLFATSGGRAMRNPGNYFLGVFGQPAPDGPWGWRFEGHHLSVSFTIVDGRLVSGTPAFFGGNPAVVPDDAPVNAGLSPFAREQQAAHAFVATFNDAQLADVVIAETAPDDIVTSNERRASMGTPEGIAYADMSPEQQQSLMALMGMFLAKMSPELAEYQTAKIGAAGLERVHFAWAGGTAPGQQHYFRIHGPTFVVEWDNTQGNGNHVHSVWRDFADDFGYDPLGVHLTNDHGLKVAGISDEVAAGSTAEPLDEDAHQRAHSEGTPHSHAGKHHHH